MIEILLLIGGLTLTLFGAEWLVNGASAIAKKLRVSEIVIGLTIVSIGTSTPEFVVSILSAINGNTEIAIGNVLGSNIANILLILGISSVITPLSVLKNSQYIEIPLGILATLLILFCGNDVFFDGALVNIVSRIDGLIMLLFFIIFMFYTFKLPRQEKDEEMKIPTKSISNLKAVLFLVLGIAALFFGGKYFVEGAVGIAHFFGMSESLIGLTIVAVGTSLPELATSVMAAIKNKPEIAVGNVIGSNIINIFLILGTTALINPLPLQSSTNIDIFVALGAALMLFVSTILMGKRVITRPEGVIFILAYLVYVVYLIGFN